MKRKNDEAPSLAASLAAKLEKRRVKQARDNMRQAEKERMPAARDCSTDNLSQSDCDSVESKRSSQRVKVLPKKYEGFATELTGTDMLSKKRLKKPLPGE
jgi:hypothetical protein